MNAVDAMRVAPSAGRLAERIQNALDGAAPIVRRAAWAGAATSVVVAFTADAPLALRTGLAIVGLAFVAAAVVDLHERRLPNRLLAAAALAAVVGVLASGDPLVAARSAAGGLLAGGLLLGVRFARGLGMGDVKMAVAAGLSLAAVAWWAAPVFVAVAALAASVSGVALRRSTLPLGPALWLGWAVALLMTETGWWS